MAPSIRQKLTHIRPFSNIALRVFLALGTICACGFFLPAGEAAQRELARNALWEVVHRVCVPGQAQYQDPKPCLHVDVKKGDTKGFAVLRDPRGGIHFLLVPTAKLPGIESPELRDPNATNYFARAWENRTYINQEIRRTLPRDDIGLVVNSASSRSQDQMHIHISCVRGNVAEALRKNAGSIREEWAPLAVPLFKHRYIAMWVAGESLGRNNPFQLLAERAGAAQDMSNHTLAVVGLTRADGTNGFVLLADQTSKTDRANGEELLDHSCRISPNPGGNN